MKHSKKVLGLDMGTNSIGWAYIDGENKQILGMGTVLFHDSRTKSPADPVGVSNAVARREARMARRQRDRKLYSYERTAKFLCETLSIKQIDFSKDPYESRSIAAEGTDDPNILARALLHLRKRRGFDSNRKSARQGEEGGSYSEATINLEGKLKGKSLGKFLADRGIPGEPKTKPEKEAKKQAIEQFKKELENLDYKCTLGQFLHEGVLNETTKNIHGENKEKAIRRFRYNDSFSNKDIYPLRRLYEKEFDTIREKNAQAMSSVQWDKLKSMIFYQRPLKPQIVGKCRFYKSQYRANRNLPTTHEYRIWQQLRNLRPIDSSFDISEEQIQMFYEKLHTKEKYSFTDMKKDIGLSRREKFNLERENMNSIGVNAPIAMIHSASLELGIEPPNKAIEEWDDIFSCALKIDSDAEFIEAVKPYNLSLELADKIKEWADKQRDSYASVSIKFMRDIIPFMRKGLPYHEAICELKDESGKPLHHSDLADKNILEKLPSYYGEIIDSGLQKKNLSQSQLKKLKKENPSAYKEAEFGKILNPTVHVALNQMVKLINEIIELYGKPDKINVELSRDLKNSKITRDKMSKKIFENTEKKKNFRNLYMEITGKDDFSHNDYQKMLLWEELADNSMAHNCLFCGKTISMNDLFQDNLTQIEHILPRSWSHDNTMNNKTVAHTACNAGKGDSTPYELENGKQIFQRAKAAGLKPSKLWRFAENARQIFEERRDKILTEEEIEKYGGDKDAAWSARQMTDTQYITRQTKNILSRIVGKDNVVPMTGYFTSYLRNKWRIWDRLGTGNQKTRADHRHHAIDAVVIARADLSMVQKAARENAADKILPNYEPIEDWLMEEVGIKFDKIIIHEKPEHGTQGPMFKETAYGHKVTDEERELGFDAVTRMTLQDYVGDFLKKIKKDNQPDRKPRSLIRDPILRMKIDGLILSNKDKNQGELCDYIYKETGVRRLRMIMKKNLVPISSAPYKAYERADFCAVNIWKIPQIKNGKFAGTGKFKYEGIFIPFDVVAKLAKGPKKLEKLNKFYKENEDEKKNEKSKKKEDKILKEFGKPHPAASFVMRLHKKDMVALVWDEDLKQKIERNSGSDISIKPITIDGGEYLIVRIDSFSTTNNKVSISHQYATKPAPMQITIGTLMKKYGMRKLSVTPTGRYSLHKYRG